MIANSTGNSTVIMSREELYKLVRADYERRQKISILEEIIFLHTNGWEALGIEEYHQNYVPRRGDNFWGKAGDCNHTLQIANKGALVIDFDSYVSLEEYNFIFSAGYEIKKVAKKLGFEVPSSFTKEDLVDRCKALIARYKGEVK